jgi:hypothetical protein
MSQRTGKRQPFSNAAYAQTTNTVFEQAKIASTIGPSQSREFADAVDLINMSTVGPRHGIRYMIPCLLMTTTGLWYRRGLRRRIERFQPGMLDLSQLEVVVSPPNRNRVPVREPGRRRRVGSAQTRLRADKTQRRRAELCQRLEQAGQSRTGAFCTLFFFFTLLASEECLSSEGFSLSIHGNRGSY